MVRPNNSWARVGPSCLAVVGMVVLTFLVLAIPAWRLGRNFEDQRRLLRTYRAPYDSEAFFTYCMDYAVTPSERNDVIFFGGSYCLCGIQSLEFENRSGLSAYNLGTIGMLGSEGPNLLFKSYLEHHPSPRVAVLCVQPREVGPMDRAKDPHHRDVAWRSPSLVERFFWCYGPQGEYPRPSHPDALKYYVGQGLLMMLGELRGGERHYLNKPTWNLFGLSYNQLKKQVRDDRGFYSLGGLKALPPKARYSSARDKELLPIEGATPEDPFPVLPEFDDGVRRLARTAAQHGVLLMIRLSPLLTGADPEHCARIRAWFETLEADFPNVVCDRPEILLYGPECFYDQTGHLNLPGAEKFTALVAASVTRVLSTNAAGLPTTSATEQTTSNPNDKAN